jgi:hypothetical protein
MGDADLEHPARLGDLLELGLGDLIALVDRFDITQGRTLAGLLSWTLRRAYARRDPAFAQARRRLSAEQVCQRLRETARQRGIDLGEDPPAS